MRATAHTHTHSPAQGYIRQADLIGKPNQPGLIPFSAATLWRKVANGTFPAPVKLSERVTAWRLADVHAFLREREAAAPTYRVAA